jgi:hypothetical protein
MEGVVGEHCSERPWGVLLNLRNLHMGRAMDDAGYYKTKEELVEFCSAYVDKKFETEKGLIRDYIGLGIKVAIVGVGAAVLTAGFFGWKSYDDVNKSALAEIKSRLDKDNPVVKYESTIKEIAVDGIIASLTARIDRNDDFLGDDAINFLTDALQDDGISPERKSHILQFATIAPFGETKAQFAHAARKLIQADFKDNRESGVTLMRQLIKLYISDNANSYVTDALNIMENYKDDDVIAQSVSAMLDQLNPSAASRLLAKLGSRTDDTTKFHILFFNLRTNPQSTLDEQWLLSLIQTAFQFSFRDEKISLSEILSAMNSLTSSNPHFWAVISLFAAKASAMGYSVQYRLDDFGPSTGRPFVAFAREGGSFGIPIGLYNKIFSQISQAFLIRSSWFSSAGTNDLSAMSFWMVKANEGELSNSLSYHDYKTYFLYRGVDKIKDGDGNEIAGERVGGRLAIVVQTTNNVPAVMVYWRDAIGVVKSASESKLVGVNKDSVSIRRVDNSVSLDDGP